MPPSHLHRRPKNHRRAPGSCGPRATPRSSSQPRSPQRALASARRRFPSGARPRLPPRLSPSCLGAARVSARTARPPRRAAFTAAAVWGLPRVVGRRQPRLGAGAQWRACGRAPGGVRRAPSAREHMAHPFIGRAARARGGGGGRRPPKAKRAEGVRGA
ncbi:MAG: hypothetical protein J3K34DRAFT_167025 [Monoraphidium minutum]|nr:MAG: hypothetical protein J3K34DRAFT_167025 [Monoraphidium minutum]